MMQSWMQARPTKKEIYRLHDLMEDALDKLVEGNGIVAKHIDTEIELSDDHRTCRTEVEAKACQEKPDCVC